MGQTLFTNVRIFDGSGKKLFPGEVLVQGNRILKVARNKAKISADGAKVVDGGGATLMPGLCEAHMHMSYTNCAQLKEIGEVPPEEHTLITAGNAKLMLDLGFTSTFGAAGSKPRLDIAVRNFINDGKIPGPRMKVASPEITSTGGLGDERQMHMHHHSIELIVDGPVEMTRTCRLMVREGVDTIKINISGDQFCMNSVNAEMMSFTDEEIAAAAEVGHARQVNLACHARSSDSVKAALKHGFNVIYHADFCDDEALDLLEADKDKIFLAPAVGVVYTTAYEAADWASPPKLPRRWACSANSSTPNGPIARCASAASAPCQAAITASPGTPSEPTLETSSILSTCSAIPLRRRSKRPPNGAAR